MINLLTIDVEDWYHDLPASIWRFYEDRITIGLQKILTMIGRHKYSATFFVLGHVAERFPELIRLISNDGHEVATHGYFHIPITRREKREFEIDLKQSISIIENITRCKVLGHRACRFSINKKTAWAIDILIKNKLKYDSSIFPTITPYYGLLNAPLHPYLISSASVDKNDPEGRIIEFPLSVLRIPYFKIGIPTAGGFYLRFLPYWIIKLSIKKLNRNGIPAVVFIHPKDLDPNKPRIKELGWHHYYGLSRAEEKFEKLLRDFKFTSIENYLENFSGDLKNYA